MSIFSLENIQGKMYVLLDLKILDADAVPKIVKSLMVENKYYVYCVFNSKCNVNKTILDVSITITNRM